MKRIQARVLHREPTGQVELIEFEDRFQEAMTAHFGDRFTRYRKAWTDSSVFAWRPDFPLSLDIEVNASCNLKCIMCVMGSPGYVNPLADKPFMPRDMYARLMEESHQAGLPAMTFGFLSEPLLHPDMADMIRLARECGVMDIRLGTNGMLLTPEISRRLIEAGLTRLEVSIDAATAGTYRRIRRGGDFDLVKGNVLDFLKARDRAGSDFPILRVSFLKLPHNEHELDDFLDFWGGKADLFSIQEPIYFEDAPISRQVKFSEPRINPDFRCAQPWQRIIVRADGSAYPCCSVIGLKLGIGSVNNSTIKEIWDGPAMKALALLHGEGRFSENRVCRLCAARSALKAEPGVIENGED